MPENYSQISELKSIDDVLDALDQIIEISVRDNSSAGIFAYVYRRTTDKVKEGITDGRFEDNERMELFDVAFARKYIAAYWNHHHGQPVAKVWERAFSATGNNQTIMQHVLLGMNAHINLDLGIAAAEFAPGDSIHGLKKDFMIINHLLEELIDEVQDRISGVSPLMFLLDWIGKSDDEAIVNFSITKARDFAWNLARTLAGTPENEKAMIVEEADKNMSRLGKLIANPPGYLIPKVLGFIRLFEVKDTGEVIRRLQT